MDDALSSAGPPEFVVPEYLAAFLSSLPRTAESHSALSLLEHLEGTYRLLKCWGSPEHICEAGLFHSIYGTKARRSKALELDRRAELRQLVGEGAESLIYAFHEASWSDLLAEPQALEAAERNTPGLCEIAVANLVEQLRRVASVVDSGQRAALEGATRAHMMLIPFVSQGAKTEFMRLVDDLS